MEIVWLGHSCFRLKGKQAVIITDPFSPDTGYKLGRREADIVTVSHDHPGHNFTSSVTPPPSPASNDLPPTPSCARPKVVRGPGEYDIANVWVTGISSFHDSENGAKRGKNCIYRIEMDDITLCHLGDIGHPLSTQQLQELAGAQVLFLPVGGLSTIDAAAAAQIVRSLEPRLVIPMHYKTDSLNTPLEPLENFLKQMALKEVIPQPKVLVTANSLTDQTRIIVLDYPH